MRNKGLLVSSIIIVGLIVCGCSTSRKISRLNAKGEKADLALPKEADFLPDNVSGTKFKSDTLIVKGEDGNDIVLMKAVKDDDGEMVATDVLEAAVITARFRNKAERNGKIDLEWLVKVPSSMIDDNWQIRLNHDMYILEDSVRLEPIFITGKNYREKQLRGYEQYEKFLSSIITDSTVFVNKFLLEIFLERNIPEVFKFRNDSSFVSNEEFASAYGVTEMQAIEHYTNTCRVSHNNRRKANTGKKYAKKVKVPITSDGVRLDTIIVTPTGDYVYKYTETITTKPKLRKVDVVLSGDIYEQDKHLYTIPRTEPLTFYISSLSSFLRDTKRFLYRIIWRQAEANSSYNIMFEVAKDKVNPSLGNNESEISRIKYNLKELMENKVFDLDSIVVTANCSPEGLISVNRKLSQSRSQNVTAYFDQYMQHLVDSIDREKGFAVDENGNVITSQKTQRIKFISRSNPENWDVLDMLVAEDTTMTLDQRESYFDIRDEYSDLDKRERAMAKQSYYQYLKDKLYPQLRVVKFDFHLHRKGMVKDSVHTTVLDSTYMAGLEALKDRDYDSAVSLLGKYNDFNAAVAFLATDRNQSALNILQNEEKTAEVNYMLAILYSRLGDMQNAVNCYLESCRQDKTYISRGNLDPEISLLIKMYGLNKQEDDDDLYL